MPDTVLYSNQLGNIKSSDLQVTPTGGATQRLGDALALNSNFVNYVTNTASAGATLTAAQFASVNGLNVIDMTGSLAAGANLTTPSLAAIQAQLPIDNLNAGFVVRVINHSAGAAAWTLVAGASLVTNGTSTVAQTSWRDFSCIITGGTTATLQDIGGGNIV